MFTLIGIILCCIGHPWFGISLIVLGGILRVRR